MAEHLARIIGTEEDRVNCPFYWKIGACRHGDQCSRSHYKPTSSQTLVLRHMYHNPPVALAIAEGQDVDDELADKAQDHFEMFYEEVFEELANYGQIEEMVVCDNIGDHMIGNLYVKYASEDDAEKAVAQLRGRYYAGRMIEVEFSPVTDFREARCRQFVDGQCTRGGYCNFMHMKHVPRSLKRKMMKRMFEEHSEYKKTAAMYTDDPSRGGSRRYDGGPPSSRYYRDSHGARDRSDIYASRRAGGGNDAPGRDDWHQQRHHSRQYNSSAGASRDYGTGNDRRAGYSSRSQYDDHHHHHHSSSGYKTSSSRHEYHGSRRGYSPADEHRERPRDAGRRQDGGRQSSQERRAMIAQWNKEADDSAAAAAGKGPSVVEIEMYPNNGTAGVHEPLTNNGPQGAPVGRSAGAPPSDPEMFFNAAARPQ